MDYFGMLISKYIVAPNAKVYLIIILSTCFNDYLFNDRKFKLIFLCNVILFFNM